EKMGPVALEGAGGRVLFGRGVEEGEYSESVASEIDAEVSQIMTEAMARAEKAISENRKLLDTIAKMLMEVETIERDDFEKIIVAHGVVPKRKKDTALQP